MPQRVTRNNTKRHTKRHTKSHTKRNTNQNKMQRGGNNMTATYYGKAINGNYTSDGTSGTGVSHGVINGNGKWAGPDMKPTTGGGCGCGKKGKRMVKKMNKNTKNKY